MIVTHIFVQIGMRNVSGTAVIVIIIIASRLH